MTWNSWNTETARCIGFLRLVSTRPGHSGWRGWGWGSHPSACYPAWGRAGLMLERQPRCSQTLLSPSWGICSPVHHAPHQSPVSDTWLILAMLSGYWTMSLISALLPSIKWENMYMLRSTHKVSVELASFYKWEIKAQEPGTCSTVAGYTLGVSCKRHGWAKETAQGIHAVHVVASLIWKDRINPTQELTFSPCIDGKWWRYQAM